MSFDSSMADRCEVPINFDTYKGCSHNCKYCFVRKYGGIEKIEDNNCLSSLRRFIEGHRTLYTNWCDWKIPLHWGGCSDPFQKLERSKRVSYKCLELLAETKYPFIVSTKGTVIADADYLSLLSQCNAVVQISIISPKYDKIENGAPPYAERLAMLPKLAKNCKRLIVRYQPYMHEVLRDCVENIKTYKECGVYGVITEGLITTRPRVGFERVKRFTYVAPEELLRRDFQFIKDECHKQGLVYLCGDDQCRDISDSSCCCGCEGLDGFVTNKFNALNIANGIKANPTPRMMEKGTGYCLKERSVEGSMNAKNQSFFTMTINKLK